MVFFFIYRLSSKRNLIFKSNIPTQWLFGPAHWQINASYAKTIPRVSPSVLSTFSETPGIWPLAALITVTHMYSAGALTVRLKRICWWEQQVSPLRTCANGSTYRIESYSLGQWVQCTELNCALKISKVKLIKNHC